MNNVINKFLLAGDNFIPETNLRQPWFTYSAWELFKKKSKTKTKQEHKNLKKKKTLDISKEIDWTEPVSSTIQMASDYVKGITW